jgi:transposase-like protein
MARRKRRTFNAEFKFETVMEALRGEKSSAQICREREISENLLSRWKSEFVERGAEIFEKPNGKATSSEQRVAELERLVGRKELEIEILKKAGSLLGSDWSKNGR